MIQLLQAIRNGDFSHGEQEVRNFSSKFKKLHKATKKTNKKTPLKMKVKMGETKTLIFMLIANQ